MSNKIEVDLDTAKHIVIIRSDEGMEWYEITGADKAHELAVNAMGKGKYVSVSLSVRQLYGIDTRHLAPRT